ncbi:MAG: amino acid racemase [Patescibacteria group bacterium]|nr:amino acid racemase [Patescibacteria group bacterium]
MKNKKAICILGGMGPQASVYMHKMLVELSARYFNAKNNEDYPEIIIYSIPIPDFISNKVNKRKALIMLKKRVAEINKLSVSQIGIACNTAHLLLGELQNISKTPFVSIIDEVNKTVGPKIKKVGLLASPTTIKSYLYQNVLEKKRIEIITPSLIELEILEKIIRKVIRGKITKKDQITLRSIANSLKDRGAEGIILGCTELPLIFPPKFSLPVFNSVEILAMALLRKYYK